MIDRQVPAAAVDVHQLTDSMSSITIDPSTLSSGELTSTHHSQKKSSLAFLDDQQQRHRLPGSYDHRQSDLGGVDDATTGHVVFRHHDDTVMSRTTPATHASASGVNFSQPITFQPGPTAAAYLQTAAESELSDNVDQFGCLGLQDLQDMLIGDEFQ